MLVWNPYGSVTSSPAFLNLEGAPVVLIPPQSQTVIAGNDTSLSVMAVGSAELKYQWWQSGAALSGATATTYNIADTQAVHAGDCARLRRDHQHLRCHHQQRGDAHGRRERASLHLATADSKHPWR